MLFVIFAVRHFADIQDAAFTYCFTLFSFSAIFAIFSLDIAFMKHFDDCFLRYFRY